jgi:hypothetical protein
MLAALVEDAYSIDLGSERSTWEILRSTLGLYGACPWLFLVLAFAVMAPWDLAKLAITCYGPLGHVHNESFLERESLDLLELLLVGPLISALHVHAVIVIGEGRRPRLASVAWNGVRVLPVVAVAAFAAGVSIDIGLLALLIPGVILWIRLSVVAQVAAVERGSVRSAWRRSWRLSRPYEGHIFGLLMVVLVLTFSVTVAGLVLTTGSGSSPGAVAAGIFVNTTISSFTALTTALLYFDLRAREVHPEPELMREHPHLPDLDPSA